MSQYAASPSPVGEYFAAVPREERYEPRGGIPSDMAPSPLKPRSLGNSVSLERSLIDEELAEASRNGDIVEEISFVAPMAGPTVAAQEQQRMQELVDLKKAASDLLGSWGASKACDARFDESTITDQIDALLPPVLETEPDIKRAEALRADEVVQDYSDLKALLRRLQANELLPYADAVELSRAVTDAVRKVSTTLTGTRNRTAAGEFLAVTNSVIEKIQQLFDIQIPDARLLHQRAEATTADCGAFESKRAADDWSAELAREETHLFNIVVDLLARIGLTLEDCERIYHTLSQYKISPIKLDEHRFDADLALVTGALGRLREREDAEARHHAALQRSVTAQLEKYNRALSASQSVVGKLTAHINNLLGDLANAHLAAWRDEKRVHVAERTLVLLDKKQSLNAALANGEEEELSNLLRDIQAAQACTKVLDEVNQTTAAELRRQAKAREAKLVQDMWDLYHDRLALVQRKYVQATQAVFASEASIQILLQEEEGVLVKKQRANAAKQPDRVADATREHRELQAKVVAEEERLTSLRAEVGSLRDDYETTMDKLSALPLSPEQKDKLMPVAESWANLVADMKDVERSQLSRVELQNHLDASFLKA